MYDEGHINGNTLRTYRLYKSDLQTETYIKLLLKRNPRRFLAMFRCGNLPLLLKQSVLLTLKFQKNKELVSIVPEC